MPRTNLKGVVLAGGLGTRLTPLTKVTNKHLLPIYNRPMIHYPIQSLLNAGVDTVLLVTGGTSAGDFMRLLGNGREMGLRSITYAFQETEGGIADALGLAEAYAAGDPILVVLGDNLIETTIRRHADDYRAQGGGAKILLKEVPDPERFGVAEIEGRRVLRIEEKPRSPKSSYAVTGFYFYDAGVFDIIRSLRPSGRNELEITDVNNHYIEKGHMTWGLIEGWWTDAGTFDSLLKANNLVAQTGANRTDAL